MDPYNLLQIADDTTILADNLRSFVYKMNRIFDYSERFVKVHPKKSKFAHMTDHEPIYRCF